MLISSSTVAFYWLLLGHLSRFYAAAGSWSVIDRGNGTGVGIPSRGFQLGCLSSCFYASTSRFLIFITLVLCFSTVSNDDISAPSAKGTHGFIFRASLPCAHCVDGTNCLALSNGISVLEIASKWEPPHSVRLFILRPLELRLIWHPCAITPSCAMPIEFTALTHSVSTAAAGSACPSCSKAHATHRNTKTRRKWSAKMISAEV